MLCLHEEFLEIKWPHSQELILTSSYTESIVDRDGVDGSVICLVSCFKALSLVIHLEDHTMLGSNKDAFKSFVLIFIS